MLNNVSKFMQVVLGYLIISALVDVGLDFILELITLWNIGFYKMIAFTVVVFWIKVEPHSTSIFNPFAFKIDTRWF